MPLPRFIRPHATNNVQAEVVEELAATPVVVSPAEVAAKNFDEKKDALVKFLEKHQEVFDQLDEYLAQYNSAIDNVHIQLKSGIDLTGVYTGPFSVKKASTTVTFDMAKLPERVKALPGVLVKNVDAKALIALIASGQVSFDEVKLARKEETKSPAVTGPKQIELKLS